MQVKDTFANIISFLSQRERYPLFSTCQIYYDLCMSTVDLDKFDLVATCGNLKLCQRLMLRGAKCTSKVMDYVSGKGNLETVKYLHSIGAKCTTNAMDWASLNGHFEVVKYLHSIGLIFYDKGRLQ